MLGETCTLSLFSRWNSLMNMIKGLPRDYMPRVVAARVCGPFAVFVVFDDGLSNVVNLKDQLWGPVFKPFRTAKGFAKLRVEGSTIVWSDQADIAPETLYLMCLGIKPPRRPRRKARKKKARKSSSAA